MIFALRNLSERQLAILTGALEKHHRYRSEDGSTAERLADLAYSQLHHTTAEKYLEELRRRQRSGEPLVRERLG